MDRWDVCYATVIPSKQTSSQPRMQKLVCKSFLHVNAVSQNRLKEKVDRNMSWVIFEAKSCLLKEIFSAQSSMLCSNSPCRHRGKEMIHSDWPRKHPPYSIILSRCMMKTSYTYSLGGTYCNFFKEHEEFVLRGVTGFSLMFEWWVAGILYPALYKSAKTS